MRAIDTSQAIQMLDLLLEFFADGPLPNRRPRLSTSQAPRLERAQSWLDARGGPLVWRLIPSQGQGLSVGEHAVGNMLHCNVGF